MKRMIYLTALVLVPMLFSTCDTMNAMLSNANINNCLEKTTQAAVYSRKEKKYLADSMVTTNSEGKDVEYRERAWLQRRKKYYLDEYGFDVHYETSPYSGARYKFSSYCSRYNY